MTKTVFYDPVYPGQVAKLAKTLLLARDAYIAAWLEWHDCCLGGPWDETQECATLEDLMKECREAREAAPSDG